MKIRHGFVSNSSSSSFVILGTKLTAAEKKAYYAAYEANDYDEPPVKGLEDADEGKYLGVKVRIDEEDWSTTKAFTEKDFAKVSEKLEKHLGRPVEVAIYVGMEAS